MIPGHIYPRRTSVRSPCYKRECFASAWKQIQHTDFEGGRPPRRVLREMALIRSRRDAAEQRAALHEAVKL
jgi:hypothetical protein